MRNLVSSHPNYKLKVTGHSLGAALAHLTGMALIKDGFKVSMTNFGQPRVGDETYYKFADEKFTDKYRVTHYKDIVP